MLSQKKPKKYLILDLDETLVHTYTEDAEERIVEEYQDMLIKKRCFHKEVVNYGERGTGGRWKITSVYRPGLREFLSFCLENFAGVAIWSAGQRSYVEALVCFFGTWSSVGSMDLVYCSEDCVSSAKPIQSMIARESDRTNCVPFTGMTPSNTLIIDDQINNGVPNPDNIVIIPEYDIGPSREEILSQEDNALRKLTDWFSSDEFVLCEDVRKLDKTAIF